MSFTAQRTLSMFCSKGKLRRVHADDDQSPIAILLGPRADIRKGAEPVDTGVSPEIHQHDFPAEASGRQRRRVEPLRGSAQRGKRSLVSLSQRRARHLLNRGPYDSEPRGADRGTRNSDESTPRLIDWFGHSPQRLEALSHPLDEERWLLERRKVSAFVELPVVDQFGIGSLSPTPRGLIELFWKGADRDRNGDVLGSEKKRTCSPSRVEPRRSRCSSTRRA